MPGTFRVEIPIPDEEALIGRMALMREWLDHRHFEATTFRYTFAPEGFMFRVEFSVEAQALAFADAFGGQMQ